MAFRPPPFARGALPSRVVQDADVPRRSDAEIADAVKLAIGDLNTTLEEARAAGLNFAHEVDPSNGHLRIHVWRKLV